MEWNSLKNISVSILSDASKIRPREKSKWVNIYYPLKMRNKKFPENHQCSKKRRTIWTKETHNMGLWSSFRYIENGNKVWSGWVGIHYSPSKRQRKILMIKQSYKWVNPLQIFNILHTNLWIRESLKKWQWINKINPIK